MYQPFETFHLTGNFISVIGSGGKTTFLRYLSERLDGKVILTTSTHIFPFPGMPLVETGENSTPADRARILHDIRSSFHRSRVICLGQPLPSGKLASPSKAVPFETLLEEADYVLVEADGAAGHPLKAHRPFEPVIPPCTSMTVCMVGASGIGRPASAACHCPGLFCAIAGTKPDLPVCAENIARVLNHEDLADFYLVNQSDTLEDPAAAVRLCGLIRKRAGTCSLHPHSR